MHNGDVVEPSLTIAIMLNDMIMLKELLSQESIDPNKKDTLGYTPLLLALNLNRLNSIEQLLSHQSIDPNIPDAAGITPLFIAIALGNIEMTQGLLEKGANPNVTINNYITPLYWAINSGHYDIATLLLEQGALLNRKCLEELISSKNATKRSEQPDQELKNILSHNSKLDQNSIKNIIQGSGPAKGLETKKQILKTALKHDHDNYLTPLISSLPNKEGGLARTLIKRIKKENNSLITPQSTYTSLQESVKASQELLEEEMLEEKKTTKKTKKKKKKAKNRNKDNIDAIEQRLETSDISIDIEGSIEHAEEKSEEKSTTTICAQEEGKSRTTESITQEEIGEIKETLIGELKEELEEEKPKYSAPTYQEQEPLESMSSGLQEKFNHITAPISDYLNTIRDNSLLDTQEVTLKGSFLYQHMMPNVGSITPRDIDLEIIVDNLGDLRDQDARDNFLMQLFPNIERENLQDIKIWPTAGMQSVTTHNIQLTIPSDISDLELPLEITVRDSKYKTRPHKDWVVSADTIRYDIKNNKLDFCEDFKSKNPNSTTQDIYSWHQEANLTCNPNNLNINKIEKYAAMRGFGSDEWKKSAWQVIGDIRSMSGRIPSSAIAPVDYQRAANAQEGLVVAF